MGVMSYPWWTETQKELAKQCKDFVDNSVYEAQEMVWRREFPWGLVREVAKRGWFGAIISEEYGGRKGEYGSTGSCIVLEELSRIGAVSLVYFMGECIAYTIEKFGSEELKKEFLPKIANGEIISAVAATEPYMGNDAVMTETFARKEGDNYIINGKKRFISLIGAADLYLVFTRTSNDKEDIKQHRHLSAFIIKKNTPGFRVERFNELIGFDNMYNGYLDLEDVRVPESYMIGNEGEGWSVLMGFANFERLLASAWPLGMMREGIRYASFHMRRRVQFGAPTINLPTNQFKLAEMILRYKVARLLTYYAAYLFDLGEEPIVEVAIGRLFNADEAMKLLLDATQCMGGDGVTRFYPIEGFLREAKIMQLAPTTTDIMKLVLFRFGLAEMEDYIEAPLRKIHEDLKIPMTYAFAKGLTGGKVRKEDVKEEEVLRILAENYKVNPGLHMSKEDLKREIGIGDEKLDSMLRNLEEKGLASLYRDRKGNIALARATYEGLKKALPFEEYQWIPEWIRKEDIF
ncbi:MAG: acyl-CoA dehydrogenase family protein [Candidatus Methanospirareceae archaeon]